MVPSRCGIAGGRVLEAVAAALLLIPSPLAGAPAGTGHAEALDRWSGHVRKASARFGIPEEWIRGVMRAESDGRTTLDGRPITSRAGAMGLMQLMPRTWAEMRDLHGLGSDPYDPRDNILAGAAYLRAMYDRFGYPGLFAAYNAGPKRYAEHLATGRPLPSESVAYVASVGRISSRRTAGARKPSRNGGVLVALFSSRARDIDAALPHPASSSLFVRLNGTSAAPE